MITIILVVSRSEFLEKVITCIELLECDRNNVNILCMVDGDDKLYLRARNLINGTKFTERLTVQAEFDDLPSRYDMQKRRERIAAIHNQAKKLISGKEKYVLSIEDDTTFGPMSLQRLLDVANRQRAFGMAEGVEIGRWGVPYVGAWRADDIYNPTQIVSVENIQPVPFGQPASSIDAGGMYFALIDVDLYKQHEFTCSNGLGPDVNFGIENRQLGFENFIVWSVPCIHHTIEMGVVKRISPSGETKVVTLTKKNDTKWIASY